MRTWLVNLHLIPKIYAATQRLEGLMDQFATDLTDLQSAVSDVANDVKGVVTTLTDLRNQLANSGVAADKLQALEAQIAALKQAHTDLQAASSTGGTGTGTGTGTVPGTGTGTTTPPTGAPGTPPTTTP